MLRNADKAYRDAVKELLSLQKILSQTLGMKVNFKISGLLRSEHRRNYDSNLGGKVIPWQQNTSEIGDHVIAKPSVYRGLQWLDLKRKIIELENLIFSEHSPYINEILQATGTRNLPRALLPKPLQRNCVSGESQSTSVSDSSKNVKVGNTVFVNVNDESLLVPDTVESSSDENSTWCGELDAYRTKVMSSAKTTTKLNDGVRKTVKEEATDYAQNIDDRSIGTWSKQDLSKFKEKTLPQNVNIDAHVLALSDSWYSKNQDNIFSSQSTTVNNEDKGESFINFPSLSISSTHHTHESTSQCQLGGEITNRNVFIMPTKSMWL